MISKKHKAMPKDSATPKVTLESLALRLEVIEKALSLHQSNQANSTLDKTHQDWWDVVGISKGSKILPLIEAEGKAIRDAERARARKKK